MRAAIGQRIDRVIGVLKGHKKIKIAIDVVQNWQVNESLAVIAAQQVIGIFLRIDPGGSGAGIDAGIGLRFVIEIGVHFILQRPALGDDHHHAKDILRRGGVIIRFSQQPRLERGIEQFCLLRFPR